MIERKILTEDDVKQTIEFANASTIKSMAKLLARHTPITYFAHTRTYDEGYVSSLTSEPDILIDFVKKEIYNHAKYIQLPGVIKDSYNLWEMDKGTLTESEAFSSGVMLARDIANGLTIVKNRNGYCDFYTFATTPEKKEVNSFYLNNLDILEKFIRFYHAECQKLIKILHLRVLRDKLILLQPLEKAVMEENNSYNLDGLNHILNSQNGISNSFKTLPLTKRQIDIAELLIYGKTNAEIAQLMSVSHRTVEHYIAAIRERLGIASKAELTIFLLNHLKP